MPNQYNRVQIRLINGRDIGSTSPIASFSPTQYRPEDPLKAPAPPRRRMPLKKKVGYDFPMTNERSGGRFLDY